MNVVNGAVWCVKCLLAHAHMFVYCVSMNWADLDNVYKMKSAVLPCVCVCYANTWPTCAQCLVKRVRVESVPERNCLAALSSDFLLKEPMRIMLLPVKHSLHQVNHLGHKRYDSSNL